MHKAHFWITVLAGAAALQSTSSTSADSLLVCGWFTNDVDRCGTFIPGGSGGLSLPHALEIGPDGALYVASFGNDRVLRYNLETGAFIDAFVTPSSGGLDAPSDIVFGPDGHLYVTSFNTSEVLKYDGSTGAFLDEFVSPNSGGIINPESLGFGPDGNLYVASGANSNVVRFDGGTGDFIDIFIQSGAGGLNDPHALLFGPDNLLYVSSFGSCCVGRFDAVTGDFVDVFINGSLVNPHGMRFGPDGDLFVTSFGNDRVVQFDGTTGAFVANVVTTGSNGPIDIVFVPESQAAAITDVTRTLGLFVSGGVAELASSDDTYYVLQSGPGFNPAEPHPARVDIGFDSGGFAASELEVTIESHANIGGPTAVTLLHNWTTGLWDEIGRFGLSAADQTVSYPGIGAGDYVAGSNRIEVRVRSFAILILNPVVRGVFSQDLCQVTLR